MSPSAGEHDPDIRSLRTGTRYPVTSAYLCLLVTIILLALLFDWRL